MCATNPVGLLPADDDPGGYDDPTSPAYFTQQLGVGGQLETA